MAEQRQTGLWLIGACGSIGSTVALGLSALRRGLSGREGLVTSLPVFDGLSLPEPGDFVLGGHEVRRQTLLEAAWQSRRQAGLFDAELIEHCAADLEAAQEDVAAGTLCAAGPAIRDLVERESPRGDVAARDGSTARTVERLAADIRDFQRRHHLADVVVINVASCEPNGFHHPSHAAYDKLAAAMAQPEAAVLPTSSIYALAAIEAGCAYVNFTPATGIDLPALRQRADELGVPYGGRDGKTGETLVKSVLAPMFAMRNLKILSWVGHNILGNRDGAVLADPHTRAAKIKSKDGTISQVVGYKPTTHTSIEYIPSLDDWKVAWDFIHFQGFLGTRMNMQFTWQGSDSILAAPLVIDLARLATLEMRRGGSGPMKHLACFFKDPMDVREKDYFSQWRRLLDHVAAPEPAATV